MGTFNDRILRTLVAVTAAGVVLGLVTVGGGARAEADSPTPTPSASESPSVSDPTPTSTPTPTPTKTATADPIAGREDPTLAEMNAARNHSMGSTVASNDPVPAGPRVRSLAAVSGLPPGIPGLDVSGWQVLSLADWNTIAANGAKFAYVKATESTDYRSSQFGEQYNDSYAAGLMHGAYHFATPNTSSGAAQANFFVDNGGGWRNDGRTLPPLLDIEYNPYGATCYGLSSAQMVSWIRDFSNTILARVGRLPAIYTTTDWWTRCTGNDGGFGANPLFIARYPSNLASGAGTLPAGWPNYTLWQYGSTGLFPGDQDTFNGTAADLVAFASNGPIVQPLDSPIIGVGDFNGDGRPDFIARRSDGTLWFYAGTGSVSGTSDPGYRPAVQIGTGWGIYDTLVGALDLDRDGLPDLIARKPDGTVYAYRGTGKAGVAGGEGYTSAVQVASGWGTYADITSVGDFSGDGISDLVGRKSDGTLWLIAGTGRIANGSTFAPAVQIGTNWSVFRTLLGIGDLNKDGKADLVGISDDNTATFYAGTGSAGYYRPGQPIALAGISTTDVFATPGDLNGDGFPDILDRTLSGSLMFFSGNGVASEGYGPAQSAGGVWTQIADMVVPGDFTGDAKPDALTEAADGTLWLRTGTGTSNPAFTGATKIGWGWNVYRNLISAGDLNGDGKPDLLGVEPDGTLWFYAGTGAVSGADSGYRAAVKVGWGWNTFTKVIGVGDLDGDGKDDLLGYRSDGSAVFYGGTGVIDASHQGYRAGVTITSSMGAVSDLIAPRDFTGDNKPDVIVRRPDGGLWLYPGTGTVSAAGVAFGTPYRIGTNWSIFQRVIAIGDADGDKKTDLLAIRPDGSASFYKGTGSAGVMSPGFGAAIVNGSNWSMYR
ncbi:GH25 family lysozyme [Leifsonia aquatica]|uniref:GH25 family lysozyme n=1 Tax=Leifsonia aquatica TaxID=144185 RepID=UPI0028A9BFA4|nr:GH25 family lysozyme [Leifsonia aquatica]